MGEIVVIVKCRRRKKGTNLWLIHKKMKRKKKEEEEEEEKEGNTRLGFKDLTWPSKPQMQNATIQYKRGNKIEQR